MSVESNTEDVTPTPVESPAAAAQAEGAAVRVRERADARHRQTEYLSTPGGLAHAASEQRVALRLDRASRALAREPLPATSAEEPQQAPEAVMAAAVERAAPLLGERVQEAVAAAASPLDAAGVVLEALIGPSDLLEARYLGAGARAARAVGRIVLHDQAGRVLGYGTGSMVSPRLLLTNHHVLEDAAAARRATVEFDFEDGLDDRPLRPVSFPLDPGAFFLNDAALDFALVAVRASVAQLQRFGFNRLLDVGGRWTPGDVVSIVQHPRGRPKEVALRENRVVDSVGAFVHYATDTEPGSSGSPVFNNDWEVVALHHASVRAARPSELGPIINEGIRIGPIIAFARTHVGAAQQPLLAGLVLAETIRVSGPADDTQPPPSAPPPDTDVPAAPVDVATPASSGTSVRVSIPIELTLSVGTPVLAGATAAPASSATDGPPAVAGIAGEAITIDRNYGNRRGYDPNFLGAGALRVPAPVLPAALLKQAARMKGAAGADAHVIPYHHLSVVINRERRLAFYTAVNIDGRRAVPIKREDDRWSLDPRLDAAAQTGEPVYANNPLDRGHLVRRLDPAWGASAAEAKRANDDTFHFTNCSPQHRDFNQNTSTWAGLENYILDNAANRDFRASVFTGPVFAPDDDRYRGVQLPRQFWKVAVMTRSDGRLSATAYLLSQAALIDGLEALEAFTYGAYKTFQVPVERIETLTGLSFGALAANDPLHGLETVGPPVHEVGRPQDIVF